MLLRPPRLTLTYTLFPYTTLFRSIFRELRIRTLACCDIKRISLSSHGAVHFHHRRRGFLAWQRPYGGKPCSIAAGAGLSCAHSEVRSLSERRSGHDVALSRSEARRVGKECVSTFRYRWSPDH